MQAHILRSRLATTWHTAASGASRRRLGFASSSIGPNSSYTSRVHPVRATASLPPRLLIWPTARRQVVAHCSPLALRDVVESLFPTQISGETLYLASTS